MHFSSLDMIVRNSWRGALACIGLFFCFKLISRIPIHNIFVPNTLAESYKIDRSWSVNVTGPTCHKVQMMHLVKTAPDNQELRKLVRKYFKEMQQRRKFYKQII